MRTETTAECIIPALDPNLVDRPSVMTGDGRTGIFPIRDCCIDGTHSLKLSRAQIRRLVHNVLAHGETFHTSRGGTLWAEIAGLRELNVPFRVLKVTTTYDDTKFVDGKRVSGSIGVYYAYQLQLTDTPRPPMDDFFVPGHEPIGVPEVRERIKDRKKIGVIINYRTKEFYFTRAIAREIFQLSKLMVQNGFQHIGIDTTRYPVSLEEFLVEMQQKGIKDISEKLYEQRRLMQLLSETGAA